MTTLFFSLAIGNGNKAVGEVTSIKVRDGTVQLFVFFFFEVQCSWLCLLSEYEISDDGALHI